MKQFGVVITNIVVIQASEDHLIFGTEIYLFVTSLMIDEFLILLVEVRVG